MSGTPDIKDIVNVKHMVKKVSETLIEKSIVETAYNVLKDDDYFKQTLEEILGDIGLSKYEYDTLRLYIIAYMLKKYVK
jgi:plasmid replication initiation protein